MHQKMISAIERDQSNRTGRAGWNISLVSASPTNERASRAAGGRNAQFFNTQQELVNVLKFQKLEVIVIVRCKPISKINLRACCHFCPSLTTTTAIVAEKSVFQASLHLLSIYPTNSFAASQMYDTIVVHECIYARLFTTIFAGSFIHTLVSPKVRVIFLI